MRFRCPSLLPWWRLALVIPVLFCLSCSGGGSYNPVRGKVLYKSEPIQGVVVTLHPKQAKEKLPDLPVGTTEEDGSFTVSTGKAEGAPAGEYVVTFIWLQPAEEKQGKKKEKPKGMVMAKMELEDGFKGAYGNEKTSTIKVEIKSGKNEIGPFNLK